MKLSLAWIFDHLDADYTSVNVADLVNRFNKSIAEIETYEKITTHADSFFLAQAQKISASEITLLCPELKKTVTISARSDAAVNNLFLIKKEDDSYRWVTLADVGSSKEGLLPALIVEESLHGGSWRKNFEKHDYIIHLDNKSINHRPDLWGHRGIAREVATLLNLTLNPLDTLIKDIPIVLANKKNDQSKITTDKCSALSTLRIEAISYAPSHFAMAVRLARVDTKCHDAIVDATNYVMLDMGQPMHAFDAQKINKQKIEIRQADNKEKLLLLDGQTVELSSDDIVVADGSQALALAGIMGGSASSVQPATTSLLLEAACFDASTIRKTSARLKKRTEASARFEKSLDPETAPIALQRFCALLDDMHVSYNADKVIHFIHKPILPTVITVTQQEIEKTLGCSVDTAFIVHILNKLEFAVSISQDGVYEVTVPSFRATKDIRIKQDIIEEIGRFFGYENIKPVLPERKCAPFNIQAVQRMRAIKRYCAYAMNMKEVHTYAFFDESFLKTINWEPGQTLQVQSPVSENYRRLVTSLIPNLCGIAHAQAALYDQMRFFEWARIWAGPENAEREVVTGLMLDQKKSIDFYTGKTMLDELAHMLGMQFTWQRVDNPEVPWYMPYQTADIYIGEHKVGRAGVMHSSFINQWAMGHAFIFELDGEFLLTYKKTQELYKPAPKYQSIVRDISMLVPLSMSAAQIEQLIRMSSSLIDEVVLVDFFEKKEWHDQKSFTFRITLLDHNKPLSTQETDALIGQVIEKLQHVGAQIR